MITKLVESLNNQKQLQREKQIEKKKQSLKSAKYKLIWYKSATLKMNELQQKEIACDWVKFHLIVILKTIIFKRSCKGFTGDE